MKKIQVLVLFLLALFGSVMLVSAGTTNLYVENWGTGNTGVTGNGNINTVGWQGVAVSQTTGPYLGIYLATGASDPASGQALPANTVYFTILLPTQTNAGMFYTTTELGAGSGGNSAFTSIDPTQYTNLTLNVEVRGNPATDTNYFAVRVGGQWYVSTQQLTGSGSLAYPQFANASVPYTNLASAWKTLTINATDVTIGSTPGSNLSGPITGIGIVELPTAAGYNYNQVTISALSSNAPPPTPASITAPAINQTVYAGGGASFLILAAGTQPLIYHWYTNGVLLTDSSKYSGTGTNVLTILNATADDAAVTYSVTVTNDGGSATNSGLTLTVNPTPADFLYAETFPYVGPNGNLPISGVGWVGLFQGTTGIYSSGPGIGNVFSYSSVATTNLYYANTNSDTGTSGLPFVSFNPDSYPAVTFQANFTPGNGAALNFTNVIAYWAVEMSDGSWYGSAKAVPVQTLTTGDFQPYQMAFHRTASGWKTLTLGANSVAIGSTPAGDLVGNIIGAGIVMAHLGLNGGGDFNFNNFVLTTNAVTFLPPTIGLSGSPYSQTVANGGGVSFGVSATGQLPFSYAWTLNGVKLVNGARVSGANTPTVTIANLTAADAGLVVALVTNSVGWDASSNWVDTTLAVTNAAVGILYSETFPFTGPLPGNYPLSSVGWQEGVPSTPNVLFQNGGGSDGAAFAYLGTPGTTVYYATTTSDTNQAGMPFPNVNPAYYPDLSFSVDLAPVFSSSNVTAYIAVELDGANWYVASSALPVPTASDSSTYATYTMAFNPAAANWKNLTVTSSGALIGGAASGNLHGVMTGAGLVFVTVGTGGSFNFDNFLITGSGLGGINVGPITGSNVTLSWVGNPAVNLSSSTNLGPTALWQDVPGTLGASSYLVPLTGPRQFYRLVEHLP